MSIINFVVVHEAHGWENILIILDEKHTLKITTPLIISLRIWLIRSTPSNERTGFTILFLYFTIKMTNRML